MIYLGIFLKISRTNDREESDLLFGFCVSGSTLTPTKLDGCHHDLRNSHMAACLLDSMMGYAVYYLYGRIKKETGGTLNPVITIHFVSMATVILCHGFLHLIISEIFNCYVDPATLPTWMKTAGLVVVGAFCFLLCLVISGMSFARDGRGWVCATLTSLILTAATLALMLDTDLEWILPSLFSISHPLSCIAALVSQSPSFTQSMGWTFFIASCMGIAELTQCSTIYRRLGGHVLYDFWLHVTVLLCLPPFAPPVASLTVKEA